MIAGIRMLVAAVTVCTAGLVSAQTIGLRAPATVVAGSAFSVETSGSGNSTLYIVGLGQVLSQPVQLGSSISVPAGVLVHAGRYVAFLSGGSAAETGIIDVTPAPQPQKLAFLAKPSRLPVDLPRGISGTVYVLDAYGNLILSPINVSFDLSNGPEAAQERSVATRYGVAWTQMNSASREGSAKFIATAGGVSVDRVIQQVPGDPCGLTITAKRAGDKLLVQTAPVRDCSGNAIPDGTIVTFTESVHGTQTTADVPIKQGIASVEMPARAGALLSVASGVVAGNEIRWNGGGL